MVGARDAQAAGGRAEAPDATVVTQDGPGPPQPTAEERAASARLLADEAAQAVADAETALGFAREHAAGIIAGAEAALGQARETAEQAAQTAAGLEG